MTSVPVPVTPAGVLWNAAHPPRGGRAMGVADAVAVADALHYRRRLVIGRATRRAPRAARDPASMSAPRVTVFDYSSAIC